ncbi:MAG: hypothetical protein AB8U36_03530, partial [Rickettsia aeschlimannii]
GLLRLHWFRNIYLFIYCFVINCINLCNCKPACPFWYVRFIIDNVSNLFIGSCSFSLSIKNNSLKISILIKSGSTSAEYCNICQAKGDFSNNCSNKTVSI